MAKKLDIVRIPAIRTAHCIAIVIFLVTLILGLIRLEPSRLPHTSILDSIGILLVSGFVVSFASWIMSAIIFAVYNKVSKAFGGIRLFVEIREEEALAHGQRNRSGEPSP